MQEQVVQLLRTTKQPMTAKQISQRLQINPDSTMRKLHQLVKFKLVSVKAVRDKSKHIYHLFKVR